MKRLIFLIPLAVLLVSSCAKEGQIFAPGAGIKLRISLCEGFNEGTTKTNIGTPDAGKTSWAEGDEVLVVFESESDTLKYITTYSGAEWTALKQYTGG